MGKDSNQNMDMNYYNDKYKYNKIFSKEHILINKFKLYDKI